MKIVFMGTPEFAVESLKALLLKGLDICAVVTVPDKAQGRGLKISASAVKQFAVNNNITVLQPEILKDESFISELKLLNADCFVVVAFKILPKTIFTIPKLGTLNVHASLLPAYRGAAPINWAIMNGESKTGVTTMLIDAKVDTGDILKQAVVQITEDMDAGGLHDILAKKGADLLIETLSLLEQNKITPIKQDESKASKAPKINSEIAFINFLKPAQDVNNQIRGLSPYPAAYTFLDGKKVKIYSSRVVSGIKDTKAGIITQVKSSSFIVGCLQGAIEVLELQMEGKKRMSTRDFLNGHAIKSGDQFRISF